MNRRMFIAWSIGSLVSAITGKPILEACANAKIEPSEVELFKPRLITVDIDALKIGPWSHRRYETEETFNLLTESIKERGIVYPITVNGQLTLIDGLRRYTACKVVKVRQLPAWQIDVPDHEILNMFITRTPGMTYRYLLT